MTESCPHGHVPHTCTACHLARDRERLTQRCEALHVDREILDNRVKAEMPRIVAMVDGLLAVVEALGDEAERGRARKARRALSGGDHG